MSNRVIAQADLSHIANRLRELGDYIDTTNGNVIAVSGQVESLRDDLEELTQDFHAFVDAQKLSSRAQLAETRLVKLRQELEQKYGHYAVIRRTTKGILQANDLAIVRQETIRAASEELMLRAPEYWLAPALVALSAWISDNEEIAQRALKEALCRDEEKTALFFALVCRRTERSASALRWAQHSRHRSTASRSSSSIPMQAACLGAIQRVYLHARSIRGLHASRRRRALSRSRSAAGKRHSTSCSRKNPRRTTIPTSRSTARSSSTCSASSAVHICTRNSTTI